MLEKGQLISLVVLVISMIAIILWLYLTIRSIRLSKRIENYVLVDDDFQNISIFDKLANFFQKIVSNGVKKLKEKKIDKFLYQQKGREIDVDFKLRALVIKTLSCIAVSIVYLMLSLIGIISFSGLILLITILLGFLIPDVVLMVKKRIARKQIEADLLKAISLMNNSFQSGKSIVQAIQTVSKELDGPLALEFDKMYQDMLHGLSFQTAFTRFYHRVDLEEVKYITSALLILNKTGGNIMEVFSSIERNFYTRRKLDMELKATVASSRLVFQLLVFLPIFLWIVIGLWNPDYFSIFFESTMGMLLFCVIVGIYLIYIIVVRYIMKVEKY